MLCSSQSNNSINKWQERALRIKNDEQKSNSQDLKVESWKLKKR